MPRRTRKSAALLLIRADRIARRLWPGLIPPRWWSCADRVHSTWPDCLPLGRLYEVAHPVLHRPRRGLTLLVRQTGSEGGTGSGGDHPSLAARPRRWESISETSNRAPAHRAAAGR